MVYIKDETIENLIKEDIPYIDLTTLTLEIGGEKGEIKCISRSTAVVTTRKIFPGIKELSIKAVIAGGGNPVDIGVTIRELQKSNKNESV